MSGQSYFGWAATNAKTTVAQNVAAAVVAYTERGNAAPAVVLLHPKDLDNLQLPLELAALDVRSAAWVARGTVLLGAAVVPIDTGTS